MLCIYSHPLQLDNACHDSFSKRVADSIYHSGLVAQCQLRRDAVRSKSSSIEERLFIVYLYKQECAWDVCCSVVVCHQVVMRCLVYRLKSLRILVKEIEESRSL